MVISLDFEIHWGVRDYKSVDSEYRLPLLGERESVPAMLELFEEFEVSVTWATVGFLFARSKADMERYRPKILPEYTDKTLFPYDEAVGDSEADDLFHYASSLIERIKNAPGQEIATHTYSHYYCLEAGQTAESFAADLESALAIAAPYGVRPNSIVFPRNQYNPRYEKILGDLGIRSFRGNQSGWMYQVTEKNRKNAVYRIARLADAYLNLSGQNTTKWGEVRKGDLSNIPASFFLRPYSRRLKALDNLRLKRLTNSMQHAARNAEIFHLWWHPHNFGVNLEENLAFLRRILVFYSTLRRDYEMESLTMSEVDQLTRRSRPAHSQVSG